MLRKFLALCLSNGPLQLPLDYGSYYTSKRCFVNTSLEVPFHELRAPFSAKQIFVLP